MITNYTMQYALYPQWIIYLVKVKIILICMFKREREGDLYIYRNIHIFRWHNFSRRCRYARNCSRLRKTISVQGPKSSGIHRWFNPEKMEIPRFVGSFLFSPAFVRSCECVCLSEYRQHGKTWISTRGRKKSMASKCSAPMPVIKYKRYISSRREAHKENA